MVAPPVSTWMGTAETAASRWPPGIMAGVAYMTFLRRPARPLRRSMSSTYRALSTPTRMVIFFLRRKPPLEESLVTKKPC